MFDVLAAIHWPGGLTEAPPDIPKCGFDGSGCPPDGKSVADLMSNANDTHTRNRRRKSVPENRYHEQARK